MAERHNSEGHETPNPNPPAHDPRQYWGLIVLATIAARGPLGVTGGRMTLGLRLVPADVQRAVLARLVRDGMVIARPMEAKERAGKPDTLYLLARDVELCIAGDVAA